LHRQQLLTFDFCLLTFDLSFGGATSHRPAGPPAAAGLNRL
jgi:hypothetical protein